MRLLLTGFEPFGGSSINPSEEVVRALGTEPPPGVELVTAILPVDRQRGPERLLQALQESAPQAVLCLGEAEGRGTLSIERVALNLLDFRIPDNQGIQAVDEPVAPDGPTAYFVTLPVRKVLAAVREAQVPAALSLSAGAYLCNQVLYTLLHYLARQRLDILAGFIHLPPLPEQASSGEPPTASMSLETSLKGVRAAITALCEAVKEGKPAPIANQEAFTKPPEGVTIRRAESGDMDELIELRLRLHREAGATIDSAREARIITANRAYLQERLPKGEYLSWVAEADSKVVAISGLIVYHRLPSAHTLATCEAYVVNMYTRPEWRGRGIATALLKEVLQAARSAGARRAWLRATPKGKLLYQKLGFQLMGNVMEVELDS